MPHRMTYRLHIFIEIIFIYRHTQWISHRLKIHVDLNNDAIKYFCAVCNIVAKCEAIHRLFGWCFCHLLRVCVCLCMEERERKRDSCCRYAIADWNALIFNQTKEWTPGNAGVDVWVWRKISTTSRFTIRILARIHCCSHGEEEQQKKTMQICCSFHTCICFYFRFHLVLYRRTELRQWRVYAMTLHVWRTVKYSRESHQTIIHFMWFFLSIRSAHTEREGAKTHFFPACILFFCHSFLLFGINLWKCDPYQYANRIFIHMQYMFIYATHTTTPTYVCERERRIPEHKKWSVKCTFLYTMYAVVCYFMCV